MAVDYGTLQVSKSLPLQELVDIQAGKELGALVLLDIYLGLINPMQPETRKVTIPLADYADARGIALRNLKLPIIRRYAKHLAELMLEQVNDSASIYAPAFEFCYIHDGVIDIKCSELAVPLFFDVDTNGYLKYQLQYVLGLRHLYAYQLYMLMIQRIYRKTRADFTIPLTALKDILQCGDKYADVRNFTKRVLDSAVQEINEKTDLICSAEKETSRSTKAVTAVRFKVRRKQEAKETRPVSNYNLEDAIKAREALPECVDTEEAKRRERREEDLAFYRTCFADSRFTFTDEEIHMIVAAARATLPDSYQTYADGGTGNAVWNYLKTMSEMLNTRPDVRHPAKYLVALMENHAERG